MSETTVRLAVHVLWHVVLVSHRYRCGDLLRQACAWLSARWAG